MLKKCSSVLRSCAEVGPVQKLLLLVLLVRVMVFQFVMPYTILLDSPSYINFSFDEFFSLVFQERTPVYPMIIRVCYVLFGEVHFYQAVTALQGIVSIVSVAFFYQAVCLVFQNDKIAFWVALLYGCCPSIYSWDYMLLTESFALSGTVIFLYFMMRYLKNPCVLWGASSVGLMFVLTFLRPTFLLFDGILLAFWVARWIFCVEERKTASVLFTSSCLCFVFIGVYASIFYNTFGFYSISSPMPRQSVYINIDRGYYLESSNEAYKQTVIEALEEQQGNVWNVTGVVRSLYSDPDLIEITKEYPRMHFANYVQDIYKQFGVLAEQRVINYYVYNMDSWTIFFLPLYKIYEVVMAPLRVANIYLIMAVELVVAFVLWIKTKSPPWVHLGVAVFMWGIVCSTVIATCDEYPRTMICVLPFAYFACASFFGWLTSKKTL